MSPCWYPIPIQRGYNLVIAGAAILVIGLLAFIAGLFKTKENDRKQIIDSPSLMWLKSGVYSKDSISLSSQGTLISPFPYLTGWLLSSHSSRRIILFLSCFITVHRESGWIGPPVSKLHINLALGSFLNGCWSRQLWIREILGKHFRSISQKDKQLWVQPEQKHISNPKQVYYWALPKCRAEIADEIRQAFL